MRKFSAHSLEELAADVDRRSRLREYECKTIPRENRGRPPFRRPKTALISMAAERAYLKRMMREMAEKKPQKPAVYIEQNVEYIRENRTSSSTRKVPQVPQRGWMSI